MLPPSIPLSINFDMRNGINTSMITSNVTKKGARMDNVLYWRIQPASRFIIVYLLSFPLNFF